MTTDRDDWDTRWAAAAHRVMDELYQLRDDTDAAARALTAAHKRNPTATTRQAADDAWALSRLRHGPLDALGRPVDPTPAGRAAFEHAWHLATGLTWTHPDETDDDPDHNAGHHYAETARRGYGGDLPPCGQCMDDELWVDVRTTTIRHRKATR